MCGRTACTLSPELLCKACSYRKGNSDGYRQIDWVESNGKVGYFPSTNFVPTFYGPVIIAGQKLPPRLQPESKGKYVMMPMMWGMIPPWHKGSPTKHKMSTNNCRIENLLDSKLFRDSVNRGNRCVVPCDGFYEWKRPQTKGEKQPYFIYFPQPEGLEIYEPNKWKDRVDQFWSEEKGWSGPKPLMLAGLFNEWESPEDGSIVYSYSVITMDSCPAFSWIHERMPAVLETQEDIEHWLDVTVSTPDALVKLKQSNILASHPVSTDVNYARNHGDHLTKPIDLKKPKPLSGSGKFMANWLSKGSPARSGQPEADKKIDRSELEGVKRQLSTNDSVEASSSKKMKEEAAE